MKEYSLYPLKNGGHALIKGTYFSDIPKELLEKHGITMPQNCFSCINLQYEKIDIELDIEVPVCDRFKKVQGVRRRLIVTEKMICQFYNMPIETRDYQTSWAKQVYERDNYTCQKCGKTEDLHAHHIYCFSIYPNFAWLLENGVTLCNKCHKKVHRTKKSNGIYPVTSGNVIDRRGL